ncbi:cyclopropane-fatty-acyl-phospholipid synthase family protein [Pseudokineococcus basanitobsidens]|uniref:Cyclopropane-fatty-acyl-phospholipid synthase family protein n=1 Tax=Pseudokineococcus basanitobsidens TaxID=1926649 RepID=A0ABU8RF89_9ACTN
MPSRSRSSAGRVQSLVEGALGVSLPLRVRMPDGSEAGPDGAPTLAVRDRRALRRLLWAPGELGLARAYVAGEIDVDGDLEAALRRFLAAQDGGGARRVGRQRLLEEALRLGVVGLPPSPPPEEAGTGGRRHSRRTDAAAISHHYDVGNDFYRLLLGEAMTYSCAYWVEGWSAAGPGEGGVSTDPGDGLAEAQRSKHELVARKLGLRPGMRLLDVGCGWGSMVLHAAREHGVRAVGVTISREQADLARRRVAQEGLEHLVEIRVQDYRDVDDGPYDAVSSIGMAEHVGRERLPGYAANLFSLLAPGGRLLNHAISTHQGPTAAGRGRSFIDAYVFPDGELVRVGHMVSVLEDAGFEVRDVQSLREHYARTLRAWVARLADRWDEAVALVGERRARVWRLYMTGSAVAFETARIDVDQVLAVRLGPDGRSGVPPVRERWLGADDGGLPGPS